MNINVKIVLISDIGRNHLSDKNVILTMEAADEEIGNDIVRLTLGNNGPYTFNTNDIMRALKACSLQF